MTHLPFIVASYALGVVIPGTFMIVAFLRMGMAEQRLAALDPRRRR